MVLALLALAAFPDWVPARWNSGDPRTLDLLDGGAVNCVLLTPANWNPGFLKKAAELQIASLGVLTPGPEAIDQARSAAGIHLNGVVLEGDYDPALGDKVRSALAETKLIVVELPARGRMRLDSSDPIIGTYQGLWPGIEIEHGGKVSTGPTSAPWINTNAGFLRFLRASTGAAVWLGTRPPPRMVIPPERYAVAVADAGITGARWIISLDSDLEPRLLRREIGAVAVWQRINAYVNYFQRRPDWAAFVPFSLFNLVQDTSSGGLLSSGLLDMLTVQHTAVRSVPTRRLKADSLAGARLVLEADPGSVAARQKQALESFASAGGVFVSPPAGFHFPATAPDQTTPTRKQMDQMQPLWELTYNATARKNFGLRTFNTASIVFHLLASPDGTARLVHLLNYADLPGEDITVYALGTWHSARLYRPDGPPVDLPVYPVKEGTGIDIPKISLLATLEIR